MKMDKNGLARKIFAGNDECALDNNSDCNMTVARLKSVEGLTVVCVRLHNWYTYIYLYINIFIYMYITQ